MKHVCVYALCFCSIGAAAQGELLGYYSYSNWASASETNWEPGPLNLKDFDISFHYVIDHITVPSNKIYFDLSAADVGQTAYATAQTHANFSNIAPQMSNGIDQNFSGIISNPPGDVNWGFGASFDESEITKIVSTSPDFAGFTVRTIAFTLNQFDYEYPVYYPPQDVNLHTYDYAFTITFYSHVIPEPATLLLLGMGGLLIRKRK